MNEKRGYTLRERARSQDETRLRIVEATMHLHEEIGARATTISAIAERAGVQRLTVYRHFPDETAVFQACTAHWLGLNPPPDPAGWQAIEDGRARAETALAALHAYYARTRRMWNVSHRDVALVPALQGPMATFAAFLSSIADDLAAHLPVSGEATERVRVTLAHALGFPCWEDLDRRQLTEADKTALVLAWIDGTAA